MFKEIANSTFNTSERLVLKIDSMHETMERLYKAALELKNIEGQSNVARLLNESPQVVKNWEKRGMSDPGMITAEIKIGCSPAWLKTGLGEMFPGGLAAEDPVIAGMRKELSPAAVLFGQLFDHLEPDDKLDLWVAAKKVMFSYPEDQKQKLAEIVKYLTAV